MQGKKLKTSIIQRQFQNPILYFVQYYNFFVAGACNAIVYGLDKETASRLTPTQIKVSMSHKEFKFLQFP